MSLTMTVEIPALDRLCGILEGWQRAGLCREIEDEIVGKLEEAVKSGVPKPKFEEVQAAQDGQEGPKEPPKAEPANVTPMPAAPAPAAKTASLADVQKAAAQMRDEGRLNQVTGMFGEFGIKKLSDLKGDALQQFAERLRGMGAKI